MATFDELDRWLRMVRDGGALPSCVFVVVGTKLDLVQNSLRPRAVDADVARAYATEIGAGFIETRFAAVARARNRCRIMHRTTAHRRVAATRRAATRRTPDAPDAPDGQRPERDQH